MPVKDLDAVSSQNATYSTSVAMGGGSRVFYLSKEMNKEAGKEETKVFYNNSILSPVAVASIQKKLIALKTDNTVGLNDLKEKGLMTTFKRKGLKELPYAVIGDTNGAEISPYYSKHTKRSNVDIEERKMPVGFTYKEFHIYPEMEEEFLNYGYDIVPKVLTACIRRIREKVDAMIFGIPNWLEHSTGVKEIYGYGTHPRRLSYTFLKDWETTATPDEIRTDFLNMIQLYKDKNYEGKIMFYVPSSFWKILRRKYVTTDNNSKTLYEELRTIAEIEDIKTTPRLTGHDVCSVALDEETITLYELESLEVKKYPETSDGFLYRVFTKTVPLLYTDIEETLLAMKGARP